MKKVALIAIKSVYNRIDPDKKDNSFEVKFIFYLGLIFSSTILDWIDLKFVYITNYLNY